MERDKKPKRHNMPMARLLSAVVSVSMVLSLMPSQGLVWAQQQASKARALALMQAEEVTGGLANDASEKEEAKSEEQPTQQAEQAQAEPEQQAEPQPEAAPQPTEAKLALRLENAVLVYAGSDVNAGDVTVPLDRDMEFAARANDGFQIARVIYKADGNEAEIGRREDGIYILSKDRLKEGAELAIITEVVPQPQPEPEPEPQPTPEPAPAPAEEKKDEQKPEETKAEEQKQEETKAEEQKPEEQQPAEQKAEEQKADEQKPAEQQPAEQQPAEQKPEAQPVDEQPATEDAKPEEKKDEEAKDEKADVEESKDEKSEKKSEAKDEKKSEEKKDEAKADDTKAEERNTQESFTFEDGAVKVTATLADPAALPKDVKFVVTPVTVQSPAYNYDAYMKALNDASDSETTYDEQNTMLYDVAFLITDEDGKLVEVQPAEGTVTVKFDFKQQQLSEGLEAEDAADVTVTHLPLAEGIVDEAGTTARAKDISAGDVNVETVDAAATGDNALEMTVDNFSVFAISYTVDFTYDGYTYSIAGESDILLSELFSILGIDVNVADVANVEFTDESLVKVEKAGDDWKLISVAPFTSSETLTVTLKNGDKYIIAVTDEQTSSNLHDFLISASISGTNADGSVKNGEEYGINLAFKETPSLQFDTTSTLTYQIPNNLKVLHDQSEDIVIKITSDGETHDVPATLTVTTDGALSITVTPGTDTFHYYEEATNVTMRASFRASFDSNNESETIHFSDKVSKTVTIDHDDGARATAHKTATFDEATGLFTYTIKVKSSGKTSNVRVWDEITGDALTFNNDVQILGSSSNYTGGPTANGFDYTFASMADGEEITITYTATVAYGADVDSDGKITADQTNNKVTVKPENKPSSESTYSKEIIYSSIDKTGGKVSGKRIEGDKTYYQQDWSVTVNPQALVSLNGSDFTDTVSTSDGSSTVWFAGNGPTINVYNSDGSLVTTYTPSWDSLDAVTDPDNATTSASYTYHFTDSGKYSYVIEYKTEVDASATVGAGQSVNVDNTVGYKYGTDAQTGTIGGGDNATITKNVTEYDGDTATWTAVIHVPEDGLNRAVVTEHLPHVQVRYDEASTSASQNWRKVYDPLIGNIEVTGNLAGETYEISDVTGAPDNPVITITFKNNGEPGLQSVPGGHDITVTLTTNLDDLWKWHGVTFGDNQWTAHINNIDINGIPASAAVEYGKAEVDKKLAGKEELVIDGKKRTVFHYDLTIKNNFEDTLTVFDHFDTTLLELVPESVLVNEDNDRNLYIYAGNKHGAYWYNGRDATRINYSTTSDGITFTSDALPKYDGSKASHYRICYYLMLKENVDINQLAADNGGKYTIENTATWNGHDGNATYEWEYKPLSKELIQAAVGSDQDQESPNRTAKYRITYNPSKGLINGGNPITLFDELNENLSLDYTSVKYTATDASGNSANDSVTYSIGGITGKPGRTGITFVVPDATSIVIEYDAKVVGTGEVTYENEVSTDISDDKVTVSDKKRMDIAGEGEGANADFKIVKVDGYNAAIKLANVKFLLYSENKDKDLDPSSGDQERRTAVVETDENGLIHLSGSSVSGQSGTVDADGYWHPYKDEHGYHVGIVLGGISVGQSVTYYLEEVEPPEKYQPLEDLYRFTLADDMDDVSYEDRIYFYSDAMQIKNWPYRGLIIKKEVTSENEADFEKNFKFKVTILNDDNEQNSEFSGEYGQMTFTEGVSEFTLKSGEVKAASDLPKDTKFKVEEIDNDDEGVLVSDYDVSYEGELIGDASAGESVGRIGTTDGAETEPLYVAGQYTYLKFNNAEKSTGSLKLKKLVTVNGQPIPSDAANKKLADGDYIFRVMTKNAEPDYSQNRAIATVKITVEDGEVKNPAQYMPGDYKYAAEYEPAISYRPVSLNNGYVVIDGLVPNTYDIYESESSNTNTTLSFINGEDAESTKDEDLNLEPHARVIVEANNTANVPSAEFTNDVEVGNLKVTKSVNGPTGTADKEFSFTVSQGEGADKKYFKQDGSSTTTAADATHKVTTSTEVEFSNLPVGTYDITELEADRAIDGWTLDVQNSTLSGTPTVELGRTNEFELENTYTREKGDFKVKKVVTRNNNDADNKVFTINVNFEKAEDLEWTDYADSYPFFKYDKDDQPVATNTTNVNIKNQVTIELKAGESYEIKDLPVGTKWAVTEVGPQDGYTCVSVVPSIEGVTGTIDKIVNGKVVLVTVTNTYGAKGEATLSAMKASNTKLGNRPFQFELLNADNVVIDTTLPAKQGQSKYFQKLTYDEEDLAGESSREFTYKIRELIPADAEAYNQQGNKVDNVTLSDANRADYTWKKGGVTYDNSVKSVTVTVADTVSGPYDITYSGDGQSNPDQFTTPAFKNDYNATGSAELKAKKASNTILGTKKFEFQLLNAQDHVLATSSSVEQGQTATFSSNELSYDLNRLGNDSSKDFTYKIRELIPEDAEAYNQQGNKVDNVTLSDANRANYTWKKDGVTYDSTVKSVTVTVTDDGDGELAIKYNGETTFITPEFKNDYTPDKPTFEKKIADSNDSKDDEAIPADVTADKLADLADGRWQDSADYDIGDNVPYRLHATVAADVAEYRAYHMTFTDKMEDSLDFNQGSVKVYVNKTELGTDQYKLYKVDDPSFTPLDENDEHAFALRIDWAGEQLQSLVGGESVDVYFTAKLNTNAKPGSEGNINGAKLTYSNNPAVEDSTDDLPWDYVIAFTYNVDVDKVAQKYDDKGNPVEGQTVALPGAVFSLSKVKAEPAAAVVEGRSYIAIGEANYEVVQTYDDIDVTEQNKTHFAFKGLDDGTYVLEETVAPAGYKPVGPIKFTVSADHITSWQNLTGAGVSNFEPDKLSPSRYVVLNPVELPDALPALRAIVDTGTGASNGGLTLRPATGEVTPEGGSMSVPIYTGDLSDNNTGKILNEELKKPDFEKKIADVNDSTGVTRDSDQTKAEFWQDSADYDIGDPVQFKLTATINEDVARFKKYHITFKDQMEDTLKFNNDVTVKINGVPTTDFKVVKFEDDTAAYDGNDQRFGVRLDWIGTDGGTITSIEKGDKVEVFFTAELLENAHIGAQGNVNGAKLTYSNNPTVEDSTDDLPWDYVIAFTYQTKVSKIDEGQQALKGAEFALRKVLAKPVESAGEDTITVGEKHYQIIKTYALDELTSIKTEGEFTTFSFKGIDDGTYVLEETKVPDHYRPVGPILFTVTAKHGEDWSNFANLAASSFIPDAVTPSRYLVLSDLQGAVSSDTDTGNLTLSSQKVLPDGPAGQMLAGIGGALDGILAGEVTNEELKKPDFQKKIADVNDSATFISEADIYTDRNWQDSADYDIEDKVPYKLTATLPEDVSTYQKYHITFHDKMEETLAFVEDSVKVTIGEGENETELKSGLYKVETATDDGDTFDVTVTWPKEEISKALNKAKVNVYFTATLTKDANPGKMGNVNAAKLSFSNTASTDDQGQPSEDEEDTDWDYVIAFTYTVDVSKVDPEGNPLAGAAFKLEKLYKGKDGADEYKFVKAYTVTEENQPKTFEFAGLDDGDYRLTETKAPKGHKLIDPVTFRVDAEHAELWTYTDGEGNTHEYASKDLDFDIASQFGRLNILGNLVGRQTSTVANFTFELANDPQTGFAATGVIPAKAKNYELEKPKFEKKIADSNDSKADEAIAGDVTADKLADLADGRWQDSADYDIGDKVPFRLKATLPSDMTEYKQYHVTFVDQMETVEGDGAKYEYNKDAVVRVVDAKGNVLTGYAVDRTSEEATSFEIKVTWGDGTAKLPADLAGAKVYLYFTAELTTKAALGSQGNVNAAKLRYTYDVNQDGEGEQEEEKPWDYVIAFTYQIDVNKLDQDEKALEGAKFTLQKKLPNGLDSVEVHEKDNVFSFIGIDDGDYVLTETAPAGYKPIAPIEFTVTADHTLEWSVDSPAADPATFNIDGRNAILTDLTGEKITGALEFEKDLTAGTLTSDLVNQGLGALKIVKNVKIGDPKDDKTVADGAYHFTITDAAGEEVTEDQLGNPIDAQITIKDGKSDAFVAQNLLPGTYTITEAVDAQTGEAAGENAPKGVYLLGKNGIEVEVTVKNDYNAAGKRDVDAIPEAATASFTNSKPDTTEFEKKIADSNDSDPKTAIKVDVNAQELPGLDTERWQDSADFDIGDKVPFKLTATLAEDVTDYRNYHITFEDKMEESLDYNKDAIFFITDKEGNLVDYLPTPAQEETEHGFKYTLTWSGEGEGDEQKNISEEALNGATVDVFFTATLNTSAKLGKEGNVNEARLHFSNNPSKADGGKSEGKKPWDYVIVFTYEVDVSKLTEDNQPLEGAEFTLQKKLADGTLDSYEIHNTGNVFTVTGLDDGDYVLTETKAPKGYKTIDPIEFTVEATHEAEWAASVEDAEGKIPESRTTILTDLIGDAKDGVITFAKDDNAALATDVIDHEIRDLSLTKKLDATIANDETALATEFKYTVVLRNVPAWFKDAEAESFEVETTLTEGETTTPGTVTFTNNHDGTWSAEATLKANQTITYVGLPKDVEYQITEQLGNGYGVVRLVSDGEDVKPDVNGEVTNVATGIVDGDADKVTAVEYTNASVYSLMVSKANYFSGVNLTDAEKQAILHSITFTVTGPNGFSESHRMDESDYFIEEEGSEYYIWTLVGLAPGDYTVKETRDEVGEGGLGNRVHFGEAEESNPTVTLDGKVPVRMNVTNSFASVDQNVKLSVTKDVLGDDFEKDEEFTFELAKATGEYASDDDQLTGDTTVTVQRGEDGYSVGEFGTIVFMDTAQGSYYYTITEVIPEEKTLGMSYKTEPTWVRVDFDENGKSAVYYGDEGEIQAGDGRLAEAGTPVRMENTYTRPGSLKVAKHVEGTELTDEEKAQISFTVTGPDGFEETRTLAEFEDESEAGDPAWLIEDLPAGEYKVTEAGAEVRGASWAVATTYSAEDGTVEIKDQEDAEVTVTNAYERAFGLQVTKVVSGLALTDEEKAEISFEVSGPDGITLERTLAEFEEADAEGNPVWSIYETDDGEALPAGTYTVTESAPELFDRDGVEYERTTTYQVGEETSVEAAELEVTASGTAKAVVTNAYDTPKGVAVLRVAKAFEGDYQGDERFEFVLADEDGNEVGRAKAANGETAEFAPIRYEADDADGEFAYTITEVVPDEPTAGVVYNTDPVEVTVTLDEDLNASVAYGEDEGADHATVTNRLEAPEAEASLSVTKQVVGEGYEGDEEFSFVLAKFKDYRDAFGALAPDSDALPTETVAKAKAGETATFGAITYTEPGLYWYTITELEPETKSEGMTYDTTPRIAYVYVDAELNVTVRYGLSFDSEEYAGLSDLERLEKLFEDLQSGKAEENVSDEKLTVSNYYTAPVPGSLTVRKVVSSTRSEDKQKDFGFRITLLESDNKTTNKLSGTYGDVEFKDGVAEFTLKADESKTARDLPFGEDGQLRYKVEETNAQGLTPRLSETKASGGSSATVTCVNTYTPPTTTPKRSTTTTSVARTSTPKTGDPTNVAVIAGIAVVAIAAIAIGVFRRRRQ